MNTNLDFVKAAIKKLAKDKVLIISIALCLIFSIVANVLQPADEKSSSGEDYNIDTFIPAGHSLIPIDVEMSENLDSLLGSYGRVNLYLIHPLQKNRYVAKAVKLVRAPKNPNVFAVLVPYKYVKWFMSLEGRFRVSLASSEEKTGTFFVENNHRAGAIKYGVKHVNP